MAIKVSKGLAAVAAAGLLSSAGPASSAIMLATFTGSVDAGSDVTNFFGLGKALDGAAFTAIFKYDTSLGLATRNGITDQRVGGPSYGGTSPILSATLEINDITDTFGAFGDGNANVTINPADGWEQTFFYTDGLTEGAIAEFNFLRLFVLSAPDPLRIDRPYVGGNLTFPGPPGTINEGGRRLLVGGIPQIDYAATFLTDRVVLAFAPVPEPSTWALLIAGFGGVGVMIRRRQAAALA